MSYRTFVGAILGLGVLLSLTIISGCGERQEAAEAPAATTTTPPSTTAAPATTDATAASLGAAQAAGPFQVTLTAVPEEPKEGETQFVATIMRDGKPVEGADVELALSMPTMNMGGPTVELDHKEGGRYEREANLSMGGMWQATVTVKDEGETGTATYTFTAVQK